MGAKLQCTSLDEDVPQLVANKSHARDADKHNETVGDGVVPQSTSMESDSGTKKIRI